MYGGGNSTTTEEVSRFLHLFSNPSWLVWGRASCHQNLAPKFPWIDNCLMVTKRDFLEMEASLWLNEKSRMLLKIGYLPYAVGKQSSIPLINLGKKWTLSWWWWWCWWWWWWCEIRRQKINLPLKRFPDSSVSSLICNWLTPGRASGHQKLAPSPMDGQLPDGDWSTCGRVNSVKCHQRLVVHPGANVQP